MDYGGIREDVAKGPRPSAVESEEFSNPDLWLQRKRNGNVRQDFVRPHSTARAYIGCRTRGRPRGESRGQYVVSDGD